MVRVTVYTSGNVEDKDLDFCLCNDNGSSSLKFTGENVNFSVLIKDIVDIEEFIRFLNKEKGKVKLNCSLKLEEKEYLGMRKFLWKDGNVAVSAGGMRLEFGPEVIGKKIDVLKQLKVR